MGFCQRILLIHLSLLLFSLPCETDSYNANTVTNGTSLCGLVWFHFQGALETQVTNLIMKCRFEWYGVTFLTQRSGLFLHPNLQNDCKFVLADVFWTAWIPCPGAGFITFVFCNATILFGLISEYWIFLLWTLIFSPLKGL